MERLRKKQMKKWILLMLLAIPAMSMAQQPQTKDVINQERLQAINARWVNGFAPGYMATPPYTGLTFTVGTGGLFCGTTKTVTASESIVLTDNTVNLVYHDKNAGCAIAKATGSWTAAMLPYQLYEVTTSGGTITGVVDVRGWFALVGTVTSVATAGVITGGTITGTGTIGILNQGTTHTLLHGNAAGQAAFSGVDLVNDVLANQGTTTTVLHGNGAGQPRFGAVVSADLNITATTCTGQFVSAISSLGIGTCTSPLTGSVGTVLVGQGTGVASTYQGITASGCVTATSGGSTINISGLNCGSANLGMVGGIISGEFGGGIGSGTYEPFGGGSV